MFITQSLLHAQDRLNRSRYARMMNVSKSRLRDVLDALMWIGAAFLLLALVNGLKEVVPLERPADPTFVMNGKPRPAARPSQR